MIKSKRLDLIFLSFGLAIASTFIDRSPSHAADLNRATTTENSSFVLQLELVKQKSQATFDRVEQDINIVRKALGLPDIKDLVPTSSNLPVYLSSSQYQYQYQYQEEIAPIGAVDRPVPQASEVLVNIGNTFSQLNFSRNVSATPQIQTLAQSSAETVDEGIYYYEGSLEARSTEGEENIVSTILRNSQAESRKFSNLLPSNNGIFARALTNEIAGTISFFGGIQKMKQAGNSFESRQLQLGEISSIARTTNFSTNSIEKSPYQIALDQQNQRFLEQQQKQQEQLKKQLEREEEQRDRAKERDEKQRQEDLDDAAKRRKDQLSQLQKNRQNQKRK